MWWSIWLIVTSFALAGTASADTNDESRRQTGLYLGIGLSRTSARVQQPGVATNLLGWENAAEGGVDLSFTRTFGATASLEISASDLRNTYIADDYLDQTAMKSKSARAGLFYKNISLGGGYRMLTVDLKTVSSMSGTSTAHLEGTGTFAYAAFSIDHRGLMRGALELQANTTELNGFSYNDISIGLRAYLLLGGLLSQ